MDTMETPNSGYVKRCRNIITPTELAPKKFYATPPRDFFRCSGYKSNSLLDMRGSPLFELLSVRVTNHTFKDRLNIYGHIRLIDEHGNEFSLFHRKRNNPKTVFLHDISESTEILHSFDIQMPRCLPSKFWLEFYLFHLHQNIVIVNDCKFIDCTRKFTYDEEQSFSFKSWPVFADYARFRCALLAKVSVVIQNTVKGGSDFLPAAVSGRFIATTKMRDGTCIERLLYDGSEELVFGALHELSILAVPAYSWLEFQADVEVEGENIKALWELSKLIK